MALPAQEQLKYWGVASAAFLAILWLLALMSGPENYASFQGFLGSVIGKVIGFVSLFALVYHLYNGIRHLVWDTGRGFALSTIRASGYFMVVATLVTVIALWVTS